MEDASSNEKLYEIKDRLRRMLFELYTVIEYSC